MQKSHLLFLVNEGGFTTTRLSPLALHLDTPSQTARLPFEIYIHHML